MTAYTASASIDQTGTALNSYSTPFDVSLKPVSFEIRIISVQYAVSGVRPNGSSTIGTTVSAGTTPEITRLSAGTVSGGSALTPRALREGAASATATARSGTGLSYTGTENYGGILPTLQATGGGVVTYTFPADFTVSPGTVLRFTNTGVLVRSSSAVTPSESQLIVSVDIIFEELRLAWPY